MMTPGVQNQLVTPSSHFHPGVATIRQTPLPPRTPLLPPQTPIQTQVTHIGTIPLTPGPQYPSTPRPSTSQWTGQSVYPSTPQVQPSMTPKVDSWAGTVPRTPSQLLQSETLPAPATSQDWARMAQQWATSRNVEQSPSNSRQSGIPHDTALRKPRTQTTSSPYVTTPGGVAPGGDATPLIDER